MQRVMIAVLQSWVRQMCSRWGGDALSSQVLDRWTHGTNGQLAADVAVGRETAISLQASSQCRDGGNASVQRR